MFLSAFIHYNLDWGVRISKVCLLGASILLIPMSIISEMPFNLFVKVIYEIFIAFAFPVGLAVLFFTYIGFPIRKIILSEKGLYQKQEQAEIEADEWETDFKDGLPAGLSW